MATQVTGGVTPPSSQPRSRRASKDLMQPETSEATRELMGKIDGLLVNLKANEEHAARLARLGGQLGNDLTDKLKEKNRRKSKEIEEQVSEAMRDQLTAAFHEVDRDKSGSLDELELALAFEAAGLECDNRKIQKIMRLLDTNNDGVIDINEFQQIGLKLVTG